MVKAEKIIKLLDDHKATLQRLEGKEIAGFALIVPPEGETIEFISLASHGDVKSFFTFLRDKLSASVENQGWGGVKMPGGVR